MKAALASVGGTSGNVVAAHHAGTIKRTAPRGPSARSTTTTAVAITIAPWTSQRTLAFGRGLRRTLKGGQTGRSCWVSTTTGGSLPGTVGTIG